MLSHNIGHCWIGYTTISSSYQKENKEKDKFSGSVKTSRNVMQTKNHNMMSFQRKKKKSSFTSNLIPCFKPKDQAMVQMKRVAFQVETSSNEESEESEDSGHTMSRNIPVYGSSNEEESENNSRSREQESSENSEREESDEEIIYHCLRRPENDVDTSSESEASYVINHIEDKLMYLAITNRPRDKDHVFLDPNSSNARPQWCDASRTRVWDLIVTEPPSIEELRCQVEVRREIAEQWEVMQDIKVQNNKILEMVKALQITISDANTSKKVIRTPGENQDKGKQSMCARDSRRDMTLKQKKSKPYSFRRDKVDKIFKEAIKNGLILPTSKRPTEMEKYSDSNYCPYHRVLGHPIEDCWVFKDWIEKGYTEGIIKFP
jgi:hypothetical protein